MSNWNASDNGLAGIRDALYRIAGYLERKEERETAIKDSPVERDLEKTRSTGEPLIKDEKIRKAVRVVCELWGVDLLCVNSTQYVLVTTILALGKGYKLEIPNINITCTCSITELCGDEEDA